jgi:deazaflavin-dependent oxidoreductase (nitroreductase family)
MNQVSENPQNIQAQPKGRTFPIEGTNLSKILFDPQHRQKFHAQLKKSNPLIVAVYRTGLLSLFGVSRTVMLLTTRGRKSGKLRSTPIGYFRIGGVIHLFSAWGKNTSWYKNMIATPDEVSIQIGLHKQSVQAQVLEDPAEILRTLEQFITESASQAGYIFGWDPAQDRLDNADFSILVNQVLVVRFIEKI